MTANGDSRPGKAPPRCFGGTRAALFTGPEVLPRASRWQRWRLTARAGSPPPSPLSAGMPVLPRLKYSPPGQGRNDDDQVAGAGQLDQHESLGQERRHRPYDRVQQVCRDDRGAGPQNRRPAPRAGGPGGLGGGQPRGEVSGDCGEIGVGPRPERLATRRSSSSLVSLPCTNAALRVLITCSRSAWEVRSRPWPVAAGVLSRGVAISGSSPSERRVLKE
jgi:hypothetical protein